MHAVHRFHVILRLCILGGVVMAGSTAWAASPACPPTREDSLGPFYVPNAPERGSTGQGLIITGSVRTSRDCQPLEQALIEWWSANSQGDYDEAHRASQGTDPEGRYTYSTNVPGRYPGRPPHVHVRVTAPGHRPLVTQLYPQAGQTTMTVDLVLRPR